MINWLLDVGCDVNAGLPDCLESGDGYSFGGMTAIVCATTVPAVKALLQRGANPNMSYTPPQYEAGLDKRSALVDHLVLSDWRDREEIARCLVRYGADPNSVGFPYHGTGQDDGRNYALANTPTAYWPRVVSSGDVDWAKQLLELYGADPNWPGRRMSSRNMRYHLGANVLQYAILSQNKPMVELLIEHGADVNQPEEVWLSQDLLNYGCETLFFLSEEQCLHYWGEEIIQFTPVPLPKKATPLSVAIGVGNDGIVDLLKEKGAVAHDENAKLPVVFSFEL